MAFAHTHYRPTIRLVPCATVECDPSQTLGYIGMYRQKKQKPRKDKGTKSAREKHSRSIIEENTAEKLAGHGSGQESCSTLLVRQVDDKEK